MGRQIVCPKCYTVFDETLLKLKNSENICLVCGASLSGEPIDYENFFPGVELGEFDSFDEDKIDMWWYSIRQPKTLEEADPGSIFTICTKCGRLTFFSYPKTIKDNYALVDFSNRICRDCGKQIKNHIFMKRPAYIPAPNYAHQLLPLQMLPLDVLFVPQPTSTKSGLSIKRSLLLPLGS